MGARWFRSGRVKFTHPEYGYNPDRERAAQFLTVGQIYTVAKEDIGDSYGRVQFKEVPGQWFNTVQFEDVADA